MNNDEFLTPDLLTKLNQHLKKLRGVDKKILSPQQFYNASDFDMEDYTSDEALEDSQQAMSRRERAQIANLHRANQARKVYNRTQMIDRIRYLESKLPDEEPMNLEFYDDQIQKANSREL